MAAPRSLLFRTLLGAFALAAAAPACSLVFSADDLSNGRGGGGGGHGGHGTTSGQGGCQVDGDCDDGRECTHDRCNHGTCSHEATKGARCGVATDCTPRGTCNGDGDCVPGEPDVKKCDDGNDCTEDHCEPTGCTHLLLTAGSCSTGDPCDELGHCNAKGECIAIATPDQQVCGGTCPGNFYVADFRCDPLCGGCLCVNSVICRFACKPSFEACCELGDDLCTAPCPGGYHAATPPRVITGQCTCGGKSVNCQIDGS
jgi:hypothetical protein